MEKRRSLKEVLVSDYSFNKASLKWIPKGGEILESIGQEVVYLDYTRADSESPWEVKIKRAYVQSIHDYEPLTGTYEIIFSLVGEEPEDGDLLKRERIIPEGFSYNSPDLHNWMHRFVPYSLHFKLGEVETHYERLKSLFATRKGMTFKELKTIKAQEDHDKVFGFFRNIQVVINTDVEGGLGIGIIAFRLNNMSEPQLLSKKWSFGLWDSENNYFPVKLERSEEESDVFKNWSVGGDIIGDMKIIDVADQTKAEPVIIPEEKTEE